MQFARQLWNIAGIAREPIRQQMEPMQQIEHPLFLDRSFFQHAAVCSIVWK